VIVATTSARSGASSAPRNQPGASRWNLSRTRPARPQLRRQRREHLDLRRRHHRAQPEFGGGPRQPGQEQRARLLAGRRGTLVLEHTGSYRDGVATSAFTVVHAEGEPAGLTGAGRVTWPHGSPGRFEPDYDLA